ncbi:SAV_2336 N-terminal domain-related protein [Streptomyces incarnatus]|uniref:SAV_2336 N-terminal domain-related protein n=1 Tax=Streptomyces incarnatus TaxID=665007 RepID=UPI000B1806FE|nr:SAV_2336 N-terminal domain-related protein [Streptomyces incarnatus]
MFERVLKALADCGVGLSSEEFLDALWLATHLPPAPAGALARLERTSGAVSDDGLQGGDQGDSGPTYAGGPATSARPAGPFRRPRRGRGALRGGAAPAPDPERTFAVPPPAPAVSVRPPGEKALGAAELALGRALRPLRLHRPDPHRAELDIPRTVAAMAETGLPDLVLRPAAGHGLDLAILVDDGVSMLPWQRLATEVRLLMERSGAFRVVHTFGLDTRSPDGPRLGYRPFGTAAATLPPSAVADPSGRTLLIVVSDGVGRAWRDGRMHGLLDRLARVSPVAVLHTLPRRMWAGTGIRAEHWRVTTRRAAAANATWRITDPVLPPDLRPFDGTPVPVLAPTPDAVTAWARLVGSAGTSALLPLLAPAPRRTPSAAPSAAPTRPHQEPYAEVLRFRSFASTEAYRLAAHLAAVAPLPVPAMQLVRQALGASVDAGHLAEVFLSGLLRRVGDIDRPPQQWQFDFAEGTRQILLGVIPPPELVRTTRAITSRLAELSGTAPSFLAWLPHPDGQDRVDTGQRALSWVDERVMRRLGVPLPDAPTPAVAPPPYDLAIRTTHSPPVPPGMAAKEVLIPWAAGEEADLKLKTAEALSAAGLTPSDVAAKIVFIAPPGPQALPAYATVAGFAHRWVDAYADGSPLDMAGLQSFTERIGEVARPATFLVWAQAGGPPADGMPTVPFAVDPDGRLDETTVRTVRYAARLRMVPPDSASAALTMLARIAALRTRGDTAWRLPVLSTGTEPPPAGKSTQGQGVDLELIRQTADRCRKEAVKGGETTEVVPVPPVSPLNRRVAEANAADPVVLLRRLGGTSEDGVRWTCPRDRGDHGDAVLTVASRAQVSCRHCYPRAVGLVRLVVDALSLTPDEAAAFILNDSGDRLPAPGTAVTARVTGRTPEAYRCTVRHPVTGQAHEAVLPARTFRDRHRDRPLARLAKGDHVVALVLEPSADGLVLSLTAEELVERVLVGFVPELTTGEVVITGIARVAGALTKIAAAPTKPASSVRGAFVGWDAERIRGAQRLLSGGTTNEKFEVIAYSSDQRILLANALVYAEPTGILIDRQRAVVAVPHHQVRSAIGRGGLNAELAGKLTGLYVKIVPAGTDLRLEMD